MRPFAQFNAAADASVLDKAIKAKGRHMNAEKWRWIKCIYIFAFCICLLCWKKFLHVLRCGWGHNHWNAGPQEQCPAPANQGCLPASKRQGITFTGLEFNTFLLSGSSITYHLFSSVQPLDVALKAALKGELEEVVLGLLMTPAQYDSSLLNGAMKVTLFSDCWYR